MSREARIAVGLVAGMLLAAVAPSAAAGVPPTAATPARASAAHDWPRLDRTMPPVTFVAVRDGVVVAASSRTGRLVRRLTPAAGSGRDTTPTVTDSRRAVYFTRVRGECAAPISVVPFRRPGPVRRVTRAPGREFDPRVSRDERYLAAVRFGCPPAGDSVVVRDLRGAWRRHLRIPAGSEVQSLDWLRDDRTLAVVV